MLGTLVGFREGIPLGKFDGRVLGSTNGARLGGDDGYVLVDDDGSLLEEDDGWLLGDNDGLILGGSTELGSCNGLAGGRLLGFLKDGFAEIEAAAARANDSSTPHINAVRSIS